jgi:hypothetical protein
MLSCYKKVPWMPRFHSPFPGVPTVDAEAASVLQPILRLRILDRLPSCWDHPLPVRFR